MATYDTQPCLEVMSYLCQPEEFPSARLNRAYASEDNGRLAFGSDTVFSKCAATSGTCSVPLPIPNSANVDTKYSRSTDKNNSFAEVDREMVRPMNVNDSPGSVTDPVVLVGTTALTVSHAVRLLVTMTPTGCHQHIQLPNMSQEHIASIRLTTIHTWFHRMRPKTNLLHGRRQQL